MITRGTDTTHQHAPARKSAGGWRRTAALFMVIFYASMGWLRLYNGLRFRAYLASLGVWPDPLYQAISGGLIGAAFTVTGLLTLIRHPQAGSCTCLAGLVFLTWLWADRVFLSDLPSFLNLLPVSVLISLATLVWMFFLIRPNKKTKES